MSKASERMPLPSFARGTDEVKAFRLTRGWIGKQVKARALSGRRLSAQDSPIGLLKRLSYELILHYIASGDVRTFERVVRGEGRQLPSAVRLDKNPFHYGLLALFPDADDLSRQDRSLFATQMLYAWRHRVPPQLLVGFIYQSGSQAEIRRKVETHVESGFEEVYERDIWKAARKPPKVEPA